jgi:molybdopterin/thiamine biosynthesis adenylyltransferase
VVAGCGNIGSHLVPHLARAPGVERVVLVDPDVYESKNLASQDIRAADSRRRKVEVQAQRLRQIRPELEVIAVADRLETLPLGHFRHAVLLGALDSRLLTVDRHGRRRRGPAVPRERLPARRRITLP